jgi:nitroreductase
LAVICEGQDFLADADTVICGCGRNTEHVLSGGEKTYRIDVAIAMSFMMLQAVGLGLGTCWVGAYNRNRLKKLLRIPDEVRVVSLLAIGYPHYIPGASERKPTRDLFAIENYMQPFE